ncbi:MAG: beta-propeller domain-containing protein [Chloroflexota bacterium]
MKVYYIVLFIIIFLTSFIVPTKTIHSFEKQDILNNNQSSSPIEFISSIGSIGGVQNTVAVDGGYAYIGEGAGLRIVDVRDPSEPASVVYLPLPGIPNDIQIGNGYAYIASDAGLQIIDVRDVTRPTIVSNLHLGTSYNLHVVDNLAYVAAGRNGLQIVDVGTPTNPAIVGSYRGRAVLDVQVEGDYAYIAQGFTQGDETSQNTFVALDVSDPVSPIPRGSVVVARLTHLTIVGSFAYVSSSGIPAIRTGHMYTIDVSNPDSPTIRDDTSQINPRDIEIVNDRAYIVNESLTTNANEYEISVVDVSDPTNLTYLGAYETTIVRDVQVVDGIAYMVGNGLETVNIANPASPSQQSYLPLVSDTIIRVEAMAGIAYVLSDAGLYTLDISDITKPRLLGHYAVSQFYQFQIQGSLAYIGSRHKIHLVNVSDPRNPILVSQINVPYIATMQMLNDRMYVYSDSLGFQGDLYIFDVSNPAEPQQIERINIEGLISVNNLAVIDNQIFVLTSYINTNEDIPVSELHRIDISDPERAILINSYKTDSHLTDMEIIGNYIYMVGQEHLHIVDREESLQLISRTDVSRNAAKSWSEVKVRDNTAYITIWDLYDNDATIQLLDVSNPAQPIRMGQIDTQGAGYDIQIIDGLVYIANGRQGLRILRIQPELIPPEIFLPLI